MEMLALPMRCLLDTFTLCHSRQKGVVVLDMRVFYLRWRVSIGPFLLKEVDMFLRDVVRLLCIESSKTCINTLERLDPQIQNNQFKLYDKQLVCGK